MERIKTINLSKKFNGKSLFSAVNISFQAGEIIGLSGKNGVGKTTFIKLLCGLIYPDAGQILINGITSKQDRLGYMRHTGALLEGSRSLYWRLSVLQNYIYFSGLKRVFGQEARNRAEQMLRFLDLWTLKDERVEMLSFGMKQRLALACSVPHMPSVILLDEPTSGLDIISSQLLEEYILMLKGRKSTILLASHDQEMIARLTTKKLTIENGIIHCVY